MHMIGHNVDKIFKQKGKNMYNYELEREKLIKVNRSLRLENGLYVASNGEFYRNFCWIRDIYNQSLPELTINPSNYQQTYQTLLDYLHNIEDNYDNKISWLIQQPKPIDSTRFIHPRFYPNLHEIKITNECHGWTVLSDSMLQQLFHNLIDNSVKHGKKVSTIRLSCKELRKDKISLTYEDDGVGIPKNQKETIFQETYGKKSGYGLYLIRKMCELYGWIIKEKGKPGKGVQFTITIPKQMK